MIEAQALISQIFAEAEKPTSFGAPASNNDNEIAELLESLRSPLHGEEMRKYKKWHDLLAALPGQDEQGRPQQYEAELQVNPSKRPSGGRTPAHHNWHYLKFVANPPMLEKCDEQNLFSKSTAAEPCSVKYPEGTRLSIEFQRVVGGRADRGLKMVGPNYKLLDLEFGQPWALLYLLYVCEARPVDNGGDSSDPTWEAELIIQEEGNEQEYSVWLTIQFKQVDPPALEDWPNEKPVRAGNAP